MSRPPLTDINDTKGLLGLGPIPNQSPVAAFNPNLHENLLETKSFLGWHYRHALNPDRISAESQENPNTQAAIRGFRYYDPRPFGLIPQNFKLEDRLVVEGIVGEGSVIMNVTGFYLDDKNINTHFRVGDIIVFPGVTELRDEVLNYNPTGPMKTKYKVRGVDYLGDKDGNRYVEGEDFVINNEQIQLITKPLRAGKTTPISITYWMQPIYVVQRMLHSLRILPTEESGHGANPRKAKYAPQHIVAKSSTSYEEEDIEAFYDLPSSPESENHNTTGGS